jgi:hypothetical protein
MRRWVYGFLLLALLSPAPGWAVQQQYVKPGTGILFADTGGTVTWTLSNRTNGVGRISARYDKNALASASGAMPALWDIRCWISLTGTNVIGTNVEYYLATSNGTRVDGEVGTADAALGSDQRRALTFLGLLPVYQTTSNITMTVSFHSVWIPTRYFSLGMWNATGIPTETSTTKHGCEATPMTPEIQNPQ